MKRTPVEKKPIDPQRIRSLPKGGFSWIDRRFVRDGFLVDLPCEAILLYLFLVAVSDADGLSFYADPTVTRLLKLNAEALTQARFWLEKASLVLYRYPLYQVLALPSQRVVPRAATRSAAAPTPRVGPVARGDGEPMSVQEFFALLGQKRLPLEHEREGGES
jgi:hypothetical protein